MTNGSNRTLHLAQMWVLYYEGYWLGHAHEAVAFLAQQDLSQQQLWCQEGRCAIRWPEVVEICVLNLAPLPFRYEVTAHVRHLWAAGVGAVPDTLRDIIKTVVAPISRRPFNRVRRATWVPISLSTQWVRVAE